MAHVHISHYMQQMITEEAVLGKYEPLSKGNCPYSDLPLQCHNETSVGVGHTPTYVSIVSCTLSILGSLLIFVAYFALKGIRNVAQKIITLLALADFFTALGYLMADWNFLANGSTMDRCATFSSVCEVQSFVTTWSTMCSFGWTCALALHFYLLLSGKRKKLLSSLLVTQNVVIWTFPLLIVLPLLATNRLGYSRYATANWCFIRNLASPKYIDKDRDDGVDKEEVGLILVGGKFWEILSYFFVVIVYAMTIWKFHKRVSLGDWWCVLMSNSLFTVVMRIVGHSLLECWFTIIQLHFTMPFHNGNRHLVCLHTLGLVS